MNSTQQNFILTTKLNKYRQVSYNPQLVWHVDLMFRASITSYFMQKDNAVEY